MSQRCVFGLVPMLICYFLAVSDSAAQDFASGCEQSGQICVGLVCRNQPPGRPYRRAGHPDKNKKLGDPGTTVWETWKLARTEVFLPNACKPAEWKMTPPAAPNVAALAARFASTRASAQQPKIFDPPKFSEDAAQVGASVERSSFEPANLARARAFSPTRLTAIVDAEELGNETRMNKEAFEFILNRNLYSIEGQEDFLNKNLAVDFPVAAKEIKAAWRMFTDVELDPAKTFRDINNNGTIEDDERGLRLLERTYHIGYGVVKK